jgi:hypothetical protein
MRFFSYLATLLFVVLLAACGGGGGSPGQTSGDKTLFTTAPTALSLLVGSAQEFAVAGGRAPYLVVSSNAAVAVAGINDGRLTVGGVAPGSADITIRDSAGASVTATVTVATQPLFTTAPGTVTLAIGAAGAQTYQVGAGAAPYTATSSNVGVVTARLGSDNNLLLTGIAAGTAEVVVRDRFGGKSTIPVTVASASNQALFSSAPAAVTIAIGAAPTYLIGGGSPPYIATSSNTSVATVSLSGGNLTIAGVAAGSATVQVRDNAGATLSLAVTVGGGTLTVNPSAATALIGDTLIAKVTGGRAPYTAAVSNTSVADATIAADGTLRVTVKQQASGVPVLISDANGLTASFTLTSTAGQPALQISPSSVSISELSTGPITLQVYGASGGVSAFTSDSALLQAFASGNTITVSTGSNGNRCVTADAKVTISAVDSTGALATSVITIVNSASTTCP